MNSHKLSALLDYCKTHLSQKRCRTILVALACVVVFGTTYALILPAVTMTTVCGLEEHEHTDDCYEEVLVCGQEEHQHTEDCYAHDDEDDTEDTDAQDPDAEEEPDEPEEEPEAPAWAEDLPDLTGNWAEDVATIAQSQEGTDAARYGDWYTETYGADEDELDTTAPFVAFCLYYAEVDEDALPREANSEAWYETLEDAIGDETPAPGDLLFYEQEGTRMGIVTDVDVSDEDEYTYTVVESDLDGEVGESERLSDADILAYVPLPENPDENGGSTEAPDEPDRPSDNDQDRDTTGDNDRADDTDSDRDTTGGDKSDASGDNAGQKDEDPADEPAETPEEDPDTLPDVPKDALSARLADGSMQVTVQTTPCQNPEHEHDSDEAYYADEPAYGVITVAATNAEPPEEDTAALYVSLNFSNEHGSVTAEPDKDYPYTLTKTGTTYTFDLPRPAPGTQIEIPFTVQYETSLDHGGTATLWCSNQANPAVAPQAKPQATKTLTWAVYEAKDRLAPDTYGNYKFSYNEKKNAFMTESTYARFYRKDNPLGVAGSFHIVAFDTATISSHANGNVLAKNVIATANFGTKNYPDELSYIVNYQKPQPNNGGDNVADKQMLVLGSGHELFLVNNNNTISMEGLEWRNNVGFNHPYNIMQDVDSTTDPFIDLEGVKQEISSLSQRLAEQPENGVIVEETSNSKTLTIPTTEGAYYYRTNMEELAKIGDKLDIKGFSLNHTGSLIVTVDCKNYQGQTVKLPKVFLYVDGQDHKVDKEVTTFEYGKVIFNFINATGVTLWQENVMDATVIAPGATYILRSNIDGSIIAENVEVQAGESHRTDFTGTLTPANVNMQCKKQVDGETPSADQVFNFVLQEWNGSEWKDIQTATNFYENINFNVSYTKESDVGEHWYCVYEKADKKQSEYTYDSTHYYIKVKVTGEQDPLNNTQLKATYTYYTTSETGTISAPDHTKLTQLEKHDNMVFHNTTDKTLPSTGGPGEWTIPSIGLLLMAGSLLVVTKQRPQRKEDR